MNTVTLKKRRRKGFQSEITLVRKLKLHGYNAVRIPVSNPSRSALPDVFARKGLNVYAFEVKRSNYYAYFPKTQIMKLFRFLDELIPTSMDMKHAVIAAHIDRKWIFREIPWKVWEGKKIIKERERILKRDKSNFKL